MRAPHAATALALVLTACGGATSARLGGFAIDVEGDALTIVHDGGARLAGLPAETFAFGRATATYRMEVGSFQLDETIDAPLVPAARLRGLEQSGEGWRVALETESGAALGALELALAGEVLELRAAPADPERNRSVSRWRCDEGPMMGFGAQTHALDHRGERVPIWVSEQGIGKTTTDAISEFWPLVGGLHQSYLPLPTLFAPRAGASWGLHLATDHHSRWDLCAARADVLELTAWSGAHVLEFAPGPSAEQVIAAETTRRGRPPLGPEWTHGVWMERVGGTQAVRDEVAALRAAGIPFSAMWSEDWRGGERQGRSYALEEDWRLDTRLYPEFPALLDALEADGVKFMAYFNTFVVKDVDVWAEFSSRRLLVERPDGEPYLFTGPSFEPTGLADLFDPEGYAFVQRELEAALAAGIDGWMADFAEWYPAGATEVRPSDGSDPEAAHHRYPVLWAQVNQDAIRASGRTDVIPFHRSGYSGAQGLVPVVWTGDQRTSFDADDGLPTVVPMMLGLGVGGFPIVTHDVAGYTSATNPPATKALFFRWTSLGALSPVMRTHHGRDADFNWRWSSDAETTAHFRRWATLHAQLYPLWRGLAQEARDTGLPIVRPAVLFDPSDRRLDAVVDAYFVGRQLYVAPVVVDGATSRSVVLPRGTFHERARPGVRHVGGGAPIVVDAPLGELPIFAPAGAIVPLLPRAWETVNPHPTRVDLDDLRRQRLVEVYLGADGATREPEGGRYALTSPRLPTRVVTFTPAARATWTSSAAVALGRARRLTLEDETGATHVLTLDGVPDDLDVELVTRW